MASLNLSQFIGRCTKDPETREAGGTTITNLSIACNEKYKDKSGEMVEKVEFVNLVFFGKLAQAVASYCEKGKEIYASGRMQTRKWDDKEGVTRYSTEINCDKMQLLGGKSDSGAKPQDTGNSYQEPVFNPDDEIPF